MIRWRPLEPGEYPNPEDLVMMINGIWHIGRVTDG